MLVYKNISSIVLKISILLMIIGPIKGYSQYSTKISILPYSRGTRADSLEVLKERIRKIVDSHKQFEKQYITKIAVICSAPEKLFQGKPYLSKSDIKISLKGKDKREASKVLRTNRRQLKRGIKEDNRDILPTNRLLRKLFKSDMQTQMAIIKRERLSNYVLFLAPDEDFEKTDVDPRYNKHKNFTTRRLAQVHFGLPYNIEGIVNSINYTQVDFSKKLIPSFIDSLVKKNLEISKNMISDSAHKFQVQKIQINTSDYRFPNKLWIYSNTSEGVIYLSPYLIRALFHLSYYSVQLYSFLNMLSGYNWLHGYLIQKENDSILYLDQRYYSDFINIFSDNIQFVIGHELAHFYLNSQKFDNIEIACDCHSANYLLQSTSKFNPGVYSTLLMHALNGGEIKYWGEGIDTDLLMTRSSIIDSTAKLNVLSDSCSTYF